MRRIIISILVCGALAGCSQTVYLRNMAGMVASCGPYSAVGVTGIIGEMRERQCVQDYQRQGYERTPGP